MIKYLKVFFIIRTSPELLTIDGNPDEGDWSLERNLQNLLRANVENDDNDGLPQFPYHHETLDDLDSLSIELHSDPDNWIWNYKCDLPMTRAMKLFLHRPDESKEAFDRPFEVEVGKKVVVSVTPNVIVTSRSIFYILIFLAETIEVIVTIKNNHFSAGICDHTALKLDGVSLMGSVN